MMEGILLELAWRSTFVGLLTLVLAHVAFPGQVHRRSALLNAGVIVLLLLPASLLLPAVQMPWLTSAQVPAPVSEPDWAIGSAVAAPADSTVPNRVFALIYLVGVVSFLGWFAAGLTLLAWWTRSAEPVECAKWRQSLARACALVGVGRVELLVSDRISSPLSWGARRPVILLDPLTCSSSEDADVIVAHEIAHIKRHDWCSLVAARIAVALFWFNPVVWMLRGTLVNASEHEADAAAVGHVDRIRYADVLLKQLERRPPVVPANAVSSGNPGERIRAILVGGEEEAGGRSAPLVALSWILLATAVPVAVLRFVPTEPPSLVVTEAAAGNHMIRANNTDRVFHTSKATAAMATQQLNSALTSQVTAPLRVGNRLDGGAPAAGAAPPEQTALKEAELRAQREARKRRETQAKAELVWARTAAAYESGSAADRDWADGERGRAAGELGRATGDAARAEAARIWAEIELERMQRR